MKKVDVYSKPKIAYDFNDFFTNWVETGQSFKTFETYINTVNIIICSNSLSQNELKDTFFQLKINNSLGIDDVSFSIIKKCFWGFPNP